MTAVPTYLGRLLLCSVIIQLNFYQSVMHIQVDSYHTNLNKKIKSNLQRIQNNHIFRWKQAGSEFKFWTNKLAPCFQKISYINNCSTAFKFFNENSPPFLHYSYRTSGQDQINTRSSTLKHLSTGQDARVQTKTHLSYLILSSNANDVIFVCGNFCNNHKIFIGKGC